MATTSNRFRRRRKSEPLTAERKEVLRAHAAAKAAAKRQASPHPRSITAEAWRVACQDFLQDHDLGAGFDEPLFATPRPDPMPASCRHSDADPTPPHLTYLRWVPRAMMLDVVCPLVPHGFMLCEAGRSGWRVAVVFRVETAAALCRVLGLGHKYMAGTFDANWYDLHACTAAGQSIHPQAHRRALFASQRVVGADGLVRVGGTGVPVNVD